MTETIVAAVLVGVFACIAAFFTILLKVMRRTVIRDTEEALAPLRDAVLRLLERGEALKAKHERLLGSKVPGVAPPAGETADLLERAGKKIQESFEAWTELQGRLDRVRALIESESRFGRARLDEARELARSPDRSSPRATKLADEGSALLDTVEAAPSRAVAAIERARAALEAVKGRPYEVDAARARAGELEARLRGDPVGAARAAEALVAEVEALARAPR